MYICASTLSEVEIGQLLVLQKEKELDEIAVKNLNGEIIGFVLHSQPKGCISAFCALTKIEDNSVMTSVAVSAGETALLVTHSTLFQRTKYRTPLNAELSNAQ